MTEPERPACGDPGAMLAALPTVTAERKRRRFAACCRRIWDRLPAAGPHVRGCWVIDWTLGRE